MSDTTIATIVWVAMMGFLVLTIFTTKLIITGKPVPKILRIIYNIKEENE